MIQVGKVKGFVKKSYLIGVALLLVVIILQACSTGGTEENKDSGNDEQTSDGGTLKVLMQSDATILDPHFITNIPTDNIVYQKVFEQLVTFNKDMEIVPNLASDWEQLDEITWEFKLNEGINFHDGTPFNADAVKATFDRLLDPETGSPQREKMAMVEEVKVIDDTTVQLILESPYSPLLSILASNTGTILSPKVLEEDPESLSDHPIGTGPFVFDEWNSGQHIKLSVNEDYWGEQPKVKNVVFQVIPEAATRLAMIETGEAHIADQVPVTEIDRIENEDSMNLYRTEGLAVEYVGFNVTNEPLDNVKLRQAISHAIEREAILEGIYNNVGTLANSAMSPNVFGYSENIEPYEYDINKAKELMKEAGYEDGVSITLVTSDRVERINMAEVIQSQLKGIGVDMDIQVLEYGAYAEVTGKGDHQMFIGGWGNATGDGDYNQYNLFHSSSHGNAGNQFFYTNEEVDGLIEEARRETDDEKRKAIYEQTMKIEIDEAVYVPIRNYEQMVVYNNDVEGFELSATNILMINSATVK